MFPFQVYLLLTGIHQAWNAFRTQTNESPVIEFKKLWSAAGETSWGQQTFIESLLNQTPAVQENAWFIFINSGLLKGEREETWGTFQDWMVRLQQKERCHPYHLTSMSSHRSLMSVSWLKHDYNKEQTDTGQRGGGRRVTQAKWGRAKSRNMYTGPMDKDNSGGEDWMWEVGGR